MLVCPFPLGSSCLDKALAHGSSKLLQVDPQADPYIDASSPDAADEPGGLVTSNTCTNCARLTLQVVDLSFNDLEGPLPAGGLMITKQTGSWVRGYLGWRAAACLQTDR